MLLCERQCRASRPGQVAAQRGSRCRRARRREPAANHTETNLEFIWQEQPGRRGHAVRRPDARARQRPARGAARRAPSSFMRGGGLPGPPPRLSRGRTGCCCRAAPRASRPRQGPERWARRRASPAPCTRAPGPGSPSSASCGSGCGTPSGPGPRSGPCPPPPASARRGRGARRAAASVSSAAGRRSVPLTRCATPPPLGLYQASRCCRGMRI